MSTTTIWGILRCCDAPLPAMKFARTILFFLAGLAAIMPGIVTWVILCSETSPRPECVARLLRFQLSLDKKGVRSGYVRSPPLLDFQTETPRIPDKTSTVSIGNLTFVPTDIEYKTGDMLFAVVSDWNTFTGQLGHASRAGWTNYLLTRKKHVYAVVYFVGQCPGLFPGTEIPSQISSLAHHQASSTLSMEHFSVA